jgi:hypothetical protein
MIALFNLKLECETFFKRSIKIYSPYIPSLTKVSHTVNLFIVFSFKIRVNGPKA